MNQYLILESKYISLYCLDNIDWVVIDNYHTKKTIYIDNVCVFGSKISFELELKLNQTDQRLLTHNQRKTKNATANRTYNLWKAEILTQNDLFITFSRGTNLRISSTSTSTPATPNKLPLVLCKNKN